jgi:hypothetical protein
MDTIQSLIFPRGKRTVGKPVSWLVEPDHIRVMGEWGHVLDDFLL